jgi:hypothetical protein
MLARHPFDLESKIGGGKSEVNNFCCKRELVATGNQVMVGISYNCSRANAVQTSFDTTPQKLDTT